VRAPIKRLADAPHMHGNSLIADSHLAQVVVHVAAERVEHALRRGLSGFATLAKPAHHQREVQNDHVEPPQHRVGDAVALVERRRPGLRHDGAIEGGKGRLRGLAEQGKH
jgi:hypothetical protein